MNDGFENGGPIGMAALRNGGAESRHNHHTQDAKFTERTRKLCCRKETASNRKEQLRHRAGKT